MNGVWRAQTQETLEHQNIGFTPLISTFGRQKTQHYLSRSARSYYNPTSST